MSQDRNVCIGVCAEPGACCINYSSIYIKKLILEPLTEP